LLMQCKYGVLKYFVPHQDSIVIWSHITRIVLFVVFLRYLAVYAKSAK
jgi:hypothetical protein